LNVRTATRRNKVMPTDTSDKCGNEKLNLDRNLQYKGQNTFLVSITWRVCCYFFSYNHSHTFTNRAYVI